MWLLRFKWSRESSIPLLGLKRNNPNTTCFFPRPLPWTVAYKQCQWKWSSHGPVLYTSYIQTSDIHCHVVKRVCLHIWEKTNLREAKWSVRGSWEALRGAGGAGERAPLSTWLKGGAPSSCELPSAAHRAGRGELRGWGSVLGTVACLVASLASTH